MEVIVKGLDDPGEECMIFCMSILSRMMGWAPGIVASSLEGILDSFEKQFAKNLRLISNQQSSEKAHNIMRSILRVVEVM